MNYKITLRSGVRLTGGDEREPRELVESVASGLPDFNANVPTDDLPRGWVWIADHYLLASEVAGIEYLGVTDGRGGK